MAGTKIFVGSLPPGSKPEELRRLFESYGVVVECDVMNRCGFVHMETPEMAETAIAALNGTDFKGQVINVEAGRPKEKKGNPGGGMMGPPRGRGGGRGGRGGSFSDNRGGGRGGGMMHGGPPGRGNFGGGGRGGNNFNRNNDIGPMRNDSFRPQRNAPYGRGGGGGYQGGGGPGGNKFGPPQRGGRGGRGGFNHSGGAPGFGDDDNQFDSWDGAAGGGGGNRRNFNESYSGGFSGNIGNGGFGANKGGQDRRGFALPGGHQQQDQFGGGFGSAPSAGNDQGPMFQRRNSAPNMGGGGRGRGAGGGGRGGFGGGRGGFGGGRGGFGGGRGGFEGGRGGDDFANFDAPPAGEFMGPRGFGGGRGGGGFKRGGGPGSGPNGNPNAGQNNYFNEFPALGSEGGRGGMHRNAPRQNMMSNRRY